MDKTALVLVLVLGFAVPSRSQSAADLSAKYPVITSYEVVPGIPVTPRHTAGGQVCQKSFERRTAGEDGVDLDSVICEKPADDIVDRRAPPPVRGKESNTLSGVGLTVGVANTIHYGCENALVSFLESSAQGPLGIMAVAVSWKKSPCKEEDEPLPLEKYPR
jgi:hypothetical protein